MNYLQEHLPLGICSVIKYFILSPTGTEGHFHSGTQTLALWVRWMLGTVSIHKSKSSQILCIAIAFRERSKNTQRRLALYLYIGYCIFSTVLLPTPQKKKKYNRYNYKIGDVFRELMGCRATGMGGAGSSSGGIGNTTGVSGLINAGEFTQTNRNKGHCTLL